MITNGARETEQICADNKQDMSQLRQAGSAVKRRAVSTSTDSSLDGTITGEKKASLLRKAKRTRNRKNLVQGSIKSHLSTMPSVTEVMVDETAQRSSVPSTVAVTTLSPVTVTAATSSVSSVCTSSVSVVSSPLLSPAMSYAVVSPVCSSSVSAGLHAMSPSNADIMKKLCDMSTKLDLIDRLSERVEELCGEIFELRQENDKLRRDLDQCKSDLTEADRKASEAQHLASVAAAQSNDLEQYNRRQNVRILGLPESDKETADDCEEKVLSLLRDKLQLTHLKKEDIEACHRLGRLQQQLRRGPGTQQQRPPGPRAVIVRFMSRKFTEAVLYGRRKLKNTPYVITEDLSRANFVLLGKCRNHPDSEIAWSKRGVMYVKRSRDAKVFRIESEADLHRKMGPVVLSGAAASSTPTSQDRRQELQDRRQDRLPGHNRSSNNMDSSNIA